MKKLLLSAIALAILAAPAFAQKGDKENEPLAILEREKKQQAERTEQDYQRMMNRTRKDADTASTRSDPWSNMRAPATNDGKR